MTKILNKCSLMAIITILIGSSLINSIIYSMNIEEIFQELKEDWQSSELFCVVELRENTYYLLNLKINLGELIK